MTQQEQQEQIKQSVVKALQEGFFMANGQKYSIIIPEALSGDRFRQYRISEIENTTSMSLIALFQQVNQAVTELQNMTKLGDAHNALQVLLNHQKAIMNFQNNPNQEEVEKFCTVFCVLENESKTYYDISTATEKIKDWHEEGLGFGFFHFLAANIITGFRELLSLILNGLETETAQSQPTD